MTLTLTVDSAAWNRHVDALAGSVDGLVPVVKGNGYGFGRAWLAERAATIAPLMAVGTIHEVHSVPSNYAAVVLTPTLEVPAQLRDNAVLTIGSTAHLQAVLRSDHLASRKVLIKIRSSMNRYGLQPEQAIDLINLAMKNGLDVRGISIHPPLSGSSRDHAKEILSLIPTLDPHMAVWVSHINVDDYRDLGQRQPQRPWFLRLGTPLWHGDKNMLKLTADVLETIPVKKDQIVGYRQVTVPGDGSVIMVGCGSANGVAALDDGRSPFHFSQHRLVLLESPHMHTSMCFVPNNQSAPNVGDQVEVQRPLISSAVDVINWI